ncbi:MAG: hypothetical protein IKI65_01960, partial [Firmicutes bacterium]|nr:hypothetical protein [Bacillota bacterium]
MNASVKSIRMLLQLAILFVLVGLISAFAPDVFLLRQPTTLLLLALSLALLMYFREHTIDRHIRTHLVAIAAMICLWMLLRGAKYIAFEETETIARHLWYMYYIPALMVPQISLYCALSLGGGKSLAGKAASAVTTAVTAVLTVLILTNDLHQRMFRFKPGFEDWDSDYSRTGLFLFVYVWVIGLLIATMVILFRRCRLSASRRLIWIPVIPSVFGVTYAVLYAFDLWPRMNGTLLGELPEGICFALAALWLSFMYIGLIPSNEGYAKLFEASDTASQIADRGYNVIYRSNKAAQLTKEQLSSEAAISLDSHTRVHRKPVSGGYVYWQDDTTELDQINSELEELGEHLAEEAELIRLENDLKKERASIEAKTRVYDDIAGKVLPQSQKITELCSRAEEDPSHLDEDLKLLCVYAAYIKRFANLTLIA